MAIGNLLAQFGNRGGLLSRMEQDRNVRVTNDLNQYRLGAAQRAEQKQNTLGELYSRYSQGDQAAGQQIAGIDPQFHMQMQQKVAALDEAQRKQLAAENEQFGRMLYMAKDNPQMLQQMGMTPEQANVALMKSAALSESLFKMVNPEQPEAIRTLETLQARPDLMQMDIARKRAGATTINNIPKPDFGYVYNDPNDPTKGVTVVPGSKADIERQKVEQALANKQTNVISSSQNVLDAIQQAKQLVGVTSTGLTGAAMSKIPATDAYNLERTVETIKANIGFDRLQAMREASPTGGALGQVAVQELNALQASIANLDPKQGREMLMRNLEKIERHYNNWLSTVSQAGQQTEQPTSGGVRFLGFE